MAGHDDDIFDDDHDLKLKKDEVLNVEHEITKDGSREIKRTIEKETSHKKLMAIGGGMIGAVGLLIFLALTGMIDVTNSETFDASLCNFGVHQDFFGERCITLDEFEAMQEEPEEPEDKQPTPVEEKSQTGGSGGTKDVSSTSDKVELEKTKDVLGYYIIKSSGDWYGDFVDIRKIPSKIEKSGDMKINFRCYTDDFAGTSTYFGTFRNVIETDLSVKIFINDKEVQSKSTDNNKALILEGSCYE